MGLGSNQSGRPPCTRSGSTVSIGGSTGLSGCETGGCGEEEGGDVGTRRLLRSGEFRVLTRATSRDDRRLLDMECGEGAASGASLLGTEWREFGGGDSTVGFAINGSECILG